MSTTRHPRTVTVRARVAKVRLPAASRQSAGDRALWSTTDGRYSLRTTWSDADLADLEAQLLAELAFIRGERDLRTRPSVGVAR